MHQTLITILFFSFFLKTIGDYLLYGKVNVYGNDGLIYTEFWLILTNSIVNPLLMLIDPFYSIKAHF
jgi:hypothetical protein